MENAAQPHETPQAHETPLAVTVVVPCYNATAYLPALFDSVDAQTDQTFAMVLFDDGSSDASFAMLADYAGRRPQVRAVRREVNCGVCRTLNEALQLVATPFTIVFAADDVMLPHLVGNAVAALAALPAEYGAVAFPHLIGDADAAVLVDERGQPTASVLPAGVAQAEAGSLLALLLEANRFAGVAIFRTEVIRSLGYDEQLAIEDWDMWCRLVATWRVGSVDQPMFVYRDTPSSLDKRLKASGRRYADAAALRAKFVGRTTDIDEMVTRRSRIDLNILVARGQKAEARQVLTALRVAGLGERFGAQRLALLLPSGLLHCAAALRQRTRGWHRH